MKPSTDCGEIDENRFKTTLIAAVKLTKTSPDKHALYTATSEFLLATFYFFANYPAKAENFINMRNNASNLIKVSEVVEKGLPLLLKSLFADLNTTAKMYRSALEFLKEKIDDNYSAILASDIVQEFDESITLWENSNCLSEYPMPSTKINLKNIPASHTWWTEEDKQNNK